MSEIIFIPAAKTNEAYTFYVTLADPSNADIRVNNPTLAAGDARVSIDNGAFANLATLPDVQPAGDRKVRIQLSAAEMNGSNIGVLLQDQTAPEAWSALTISIHTYAVDADDLVRSTTPANTLDVSATGEAGVDWANVGGAATANVLSGTTIGTLTTYTGNTVQTGDSFARLGAPVGASISADVATVDGNVDSILTDTNELQTDWANGGRLDLLIDAITADTNELQTDWTDGGRLDLIIDAIVADTNELQTDWVDAGRLDAILDTINTNASAVLTDTGTTGVLVSLAQAIPEGQSARTVGGSLEVTEAAERNLLTDAGVGGNRILYRSDGTTQLVSRAHTATALTP